MMNPHDRMPQEVAIRMFLIRRLNVNLQVILRSSGLVRIEPYGCKKENLRLWTGIATTQSALAQLQLEQNRESNQYDLLCSLFQRGGWEIIRQNEWTEFSL
jgi:hypothetical protein